MKCLMEIDSKFGLTWQEKLAYLAYRMSKIAGELPPVTHHFEHGMYVREMIIPPSIVFIGRPHRHGHLVRLLEGSVVLMDEQPGSQRAKSTHMEAPAALMTKPNYQTVFFTRARVVGRTYHPNPTESRDIAALEAEAFLPAEDQLILGGIVRNRIRAIEAGEPVRLLEAS